MTQTPPCKTCRKPTMRWGWYEDTREDIEYWYCQECDTIQVRPRRWPNEDRPTKVRMHHMGTLDLLTRNVCLRGYHAFPYEDAEISIVETYAANFWPAQTYVLRPNIHHLMNLRDMLISCHGVDILALNGFLRLSYGDKKRDILPPIAEKQDGRWIICDGMHRLYLAQLLNVKVSVLCIEGVDPDYPYYAYPNPGMWKDVQVVDSVPNSQNKKWHRMYNYKDFYRDFNTAFENVGDSRKTSQE